MALQTASVFGNNMVLQREKNVKIWGTGEPGKKVSVQIQGQTVQTKAAEDGKWMAQLEPLTASNRETLTITCNEEQIIYSDLAVGEVWLAGGQSNMEFFMHYDKDFEEERKKCQNPLIRFFDYPEITCERAARERDYTTEFGFWRTCDMDNLDYFSAVGYYFARDLQKSLSVPVGIVACNCGGTRSCCWMDEETVKKYGPVWLEDYENGLNGVDLKAAEDAYFGNALVNPTHPFDNPIKERMMKGLPLEELLANFAAMGDEGLSNTIGPWHEWRPSGLYHMMLEQVMPYTVRGAIYYQGESDCDHPELYSGMLKGLIGLWREKWDDEFPFLMTQLAPLGGAVDPTSVAYPALREQQAMAAAEIPNVYLASIGDVGNSYDIHPKEKQPVGARLALLARGHVYGEEILCEAPVPESGKRTGREIEITFANAEGGLHCGRGDARKDTEINAIQVFDEAGNLIEGWSATAEDNRLMITLDSDVKGDIRVAFARTPYYEVNLYNKMNIPVKPFEMVFTVE